MIKAITTFVGCISRKLFFLYFILIDLVLVYVCVLHPTELQKIANESDRMRMKWGGEGGTLDLDLELSAVFHFVL